MNLQSIAFAQIQKVDEATQMVYGRAVQEVADRSKEIFDYASSKPYFEAWSKSQSEASMGKSHGNIRAMHAPKAVGIVVPGGMVFHDDECAIDYAVKVSDPAEFGKCLDGTYTGFSIGGSYVKKWKDPANPELTRYTANPSETSLVDRPCVGTATFTAVKADGTEMQKTFKVAEPTAPSRKSMIEFLAKKDNATEDLGMLGDAEVLAKYTEQRAADQAAIDAGPVMNVVVGDPAELEQFATLLTQKNMTLGDVVKALKPIIDPYAPSAADIVLRAKQMAKSLVTPQAVEAAARKLCEAAGKDPDSRKQAGDYSVQAWMDFRKQAEDQLKKASGGDSWKAHVVASDRALRDEALGITPEKLEAEVIKQAAGAEATDAHREAALVELRKAENVALADLQKRSLPQPLQRVLFGKGMFADPINKKYPLDTVDQVKAAWAYVNKAGTAKLYDAEALTALKATVADAWKAKLGGEPPVEKDAEAEMQKIEGELNKGMYTVSSLARILDDLSYVCSSCDYEAASEGDGSAIPGRLAMCLKDLGSICVDMCAEEVGELTAPKEAMKATATELVKVADAMVKVGARNSSADMKRIQTMHDHAVDLGAACGAKDDAADKGAGGGDMQKALNAATDALAKFEVQAKADREALEKRIKTLEDQPAPTRVNAVLKVVTRGQQINEDEAGGAPEVNPVLKADGSVDDVATAIKASHATGGVVINRAKG